jgi:hypothetical protein
MTTQANLYVNKGADFGINLELEAEVEDGDVFDISNKTFHSSFRKHYSTSIIANAEITIIDSATNVIEFFISGDITRNLDDGNYVYDVIMVNPSGSITKIIEGLLKIVPTVTEV